MIKKLFIKLALVMIVLIIAIILDQLKYKGKQTSVEIDTKDADTPPVSNGEENDTISEPVEPDDLTKISGIGPKISEVLKKAGILSYAQLGDADEDALKQIMQDAGLRFGNPASWIEQANGLRRD